jgi:hypothetical protein
VLKKNYCLAILFCFINYVAWDFVCLKTLLLGHALFSYQFTYHGICETVASRVKCSNLVRSSDFSASHCRTQNLYLSVAMKRKS